MGTETYTIGTVIRVGENLAMIAGHEFVEKNGKLQFYYVILPYPLGYQSMESVKRLPEGNYEVIHSGMLSQIGQSLGNLYSCIRRAADSVTPEEIKYALEHLNESEDQIQ